MHNLKNMAYDTGEERQERTPLKALKTKTVDCEHCPSVNPSRALLPSTICSHRMNVLSVLHLSGSRRLGTKGSTEGVKSRMLDLSLSAGRGAPVETAPSSATPALSMTNCFKS